MKKIIWISAFLISALVPGTKLGHAAEPGAFRIEIQEKQAIRDTEILPLAGAEGDAKKNVTVRVHTAKEVWALEKTPDTPEVFKRELGVWESELSVLPREAAGYYPVDVIMSLRLPSGTVKRVERRLELASAGALTEEANTLGQLRNDFVDLVRNQYWPVDENLAGQFDEVLVKFASKHIQKVTADLPAALAKQDQETVRRTKILADRKEQFETQEIARVKELEEAVRGKFVNIAKENEKIEEDTNFVLVEEGRDKPAAVSPQYTRRIHFTLTALAQNGVERYRIAEVTYHAKTLQFLDGKFRTNFRLDLYYMMRDKYSTSKNFEHEGAFNEKVFLENWRKNFWRGAAAKLINAGKNETDKAERAYIVTQLEPLIFAEQYAFPEFLAKAKFSFQSSSIQKELRKLRKKH